MAGWTGCKHPKNLPASGAGVPTKPSEAKKHLHSCIPQEFLVCKDKPPPPPRGQFLSFDPCATRYHTGGGPSIHCRLQDRDPQAVVGCGDFTMLPAQDMERCSHVTPRATRLLHGTGFLGRDNFETVPQKRLAWMGKDVDLVVGMPCCRGGG